MESNIIRDLLVSTLRKIIGDTWETLYETACETYGINGENPKPDDIPKLGRGLVEVLKPYGEEKLTLFLKTMHQIQIILDKENVEKEVIGEILLYIGDLFLVIGDFKEALSNYFEVENIATTSDHKVLVARAIKRVGDVYSAKGDYATAIDKYEEAKSISEGVGDYGGVAEALRELGEIEWKQGKFNKAKERIKVAIEIAEKSQNLILKEKILLTFARIYLYQGDVQVAHQYLKTAIEILKKIRDPFEICRIYNTFGVLYYTLEEYEKASEYFRETVNQSKKMGETLTYTYGLINLGSCYIHLSKIEEAEKLLDEARMLVTKLENRYALGILYSILGRLNAAKMNWELAKENFANAISTLEALNLRLNLAWTYTYIADMYIAKGDEGIAATYLDKAKDIFTEIGSKYLSERYEKKAKELAMKARAKIQPR
ncbi:MAG: tetratricopeptide repeat protein [Thermoplasmata archaeon]